MSHAAQVAERQRVRDAHVAHAQLMTARRDLKVQKLLEENEAAGKALFEVLGRDRNSPRANLWRSTLEHFSQLKPSSRLEAFIWVRVTDQVCCVVNPKSISEWKHTRARPKSRFSRNSVHM